MAGHAGRSPPFRFAHALPGSPGRSVPAGAAGTPCAGSFCGRTGWRNARGGPVIPAAGRALPALAERVGERLPEVRAAPDPYAAPGRPRRRRPRHGGGPPAGGTRPRHAGPGGRRRRPPAVGGDGGPAPSAGLGRVLPAASCATGSARSATGCLAGSASGRRPGGPRRGTPGSGGPPPPRAREHRPRGPLPPLPADARRPGVRPRVRGPAHGGGACRGRLGGPAVSVRPGGGLHARRTGDRPRTGFRPTGG